MPVGKECRGKALHPFIEKNSGVRSQNSVWILCDWWGSDGYV